MSKTPRTDAEEFTVKDGGEWDGKAVHSSFARMLEEELAQAKREIRFLRFYGNKDCTAMADEAIEYLRAK